MKNANSKLQEGWLAVERKAVLAVTVTVVVVVVVVIISVYDW